MIEARRFRHGVQEAEPVDVADLAHARGGKGTLLIVEAIDFTEADLDHLASQLPIHPLALDAASEWAVDLGGAVPKGYDSVAWTPALVVSVCDRARESGIPFPAPALHWSIPDPVTAGDKADFRRAFGAVASRIDRLAAARSGSSQPLES